MAPDCFLCKSRPKRDNDVSFHQFPKDPYLRQRWMNASGCLPHDDVTNVRLCSKHFVNKRTSFATGKLVVHLDRGAIPSIGVPNPPQNDSSVPEVTLTGNEQTHCSPLQPLVNNHDKNDSNCEPESVQLYNEDMSVDTNSELSDQMDQKIFYTASGTTGETEHLEKSPASLRFHSRNPSTDSVDPTSLFISCPCRGASIKETEINTATDGIDLVDIPDVDKENVSLDTNNNSSMDGTEADTQPDAIGLANSPHVSAKKRRFYEPRYPQEVTYEDLTCSPKRAKRVLNMILETDRWKSKEIERYRKKATYFQKKLESLRSILKTKGKDTVMAT